MTRKQQRAAMRDRKKRAVVHGLINYARKHIKRFGLATPTNYRRKMVRYLWQ